MGISGKDYEGSPNVGDSLEGFIDGGDYESVAGKPISVT